MSDSRNTNTRRAGHAKPRHKELSKGDGPIKKFGYQLTPEQQSEMDKEPFIPAIPRHGNNRKMYAKDKVKKRRAERHSSKRIDTDG